MKETNSNTGRYPYRVLNWVFLSVLILILAYSAALSPEKKNYPIPSGSRFFSGKPLPSTGLSRSFSSIMRFRLKEAREYNQHGLRLFLFFLAQVFMRMAGLVLVRRLPEQSLNFLFYTDAGISAALFLVCFRPFLKAFYEIPGIG